MYRINLYPAGALRRDARAGAVRRTGLLAFLAGLQLLCLTLFVLASQLLASRARDTEARARALDERIRQVVVPGGRLVVDQARLLVERRAGRHVWWPVLNELNANLPRDLILERIEILGPGAPGAFTGMQLFGRLRAGNDVNGVVGYIDRFSQAPAYRTQFERARLERVDNSQEVARFVIACPLLQEAPADSIGGGRLD